MTTFPRIRTALLIGLFTPVGVTPLLAQRTPPSPPDAPSPATAPRAPRVYINGQALKPGGRLGVTLSTGNGAADTLGVLISDVEAGAPADKAGIRDGARIVSIDGVDLRVDPRDLGDSAAEMLPESRLRRRLSEKSPGETVTLEIRQDGRTETKRVTLGDSPTARIFTTAAGPNARRVLGVGFSQRGSMRDTAGLLITSLTDGGAAEKAGLMEGDRIVSVDGVDLRVPAADAGTPEGVEARIARLRRALDGARDAQSVRLEVLSEGRRRTITVTPTTETGWGWSISPAQMQGMAADIRASVNRNMALTDEDRRDIERMRAEAVREGQRARAEAERSMRDAERDLRDGQRDMARARIEIERTERDARRAQRDDDDDDDDEMEVRVPLRVTPRAMPRRNGSNNSNTLRGRTDGATLNLDGLSLASVDQDFAQQFGRGAERGALVVRASDDWAPLRAGDVILAVETRAVRDGNVLDITFDRDRDQRVEILRNGRMQIVVLRPSR